MKATLIAVVACLAFSVRATAQAGLDRHHQARVLVLRGQQSALTFAPGSGDRAAEYARRAIRADSTYAPAWALLSSTGFGGDRAGAKAAATRAITLDSTFSDAWVALGTVQFGERDFLAASRTLDRAIQLDPRNFGASYYKGVLLTALGRYEEALKYTQRTFELEPNLSGDG